MKLYLIVGVLSASVLSACGSSSGTSESAVQPIVPVEFEEFAAIRADLADAFEGADFTDTANIPTTGSADYSGLIGVGGTATAQDADQAVVTGQINVNVNFGNDEIEGIASNFFNEDDGSTFDSDVEISGTLDKETGTFTGTLEGTFEPRLGNEDTTLQADLTGGLFGDDASGIGGSGTGDIVFDDERGTLGLGVIFGAEQQ